MTSQRDVQKRQIWEVRLGRFRASGLTVARFCEQERVPVHAFYYWSRRIGAAFKTPAARHAGRKHGGSLSLPQQARTDGIRPAEVVRFVWTATNVEVSVPAECLDAIRCLAECLPDARWKQADAFREVVVRS